jgi:hypothetical protein
MTSIEHDNDAGLAGFLAGYRAGAGDADPVPITVTYAVIGLTNFGEQPVPSTRLAEILGRPAGEAEAPARQWAGPARRWRTGSSPLTSSAPGRLPGVTSRSVTAGSA